MNLLSAQPQLPPSSTEMNELRARGARVFEEKGLPTRKDEAWKYTSVKALSEREFRSTALTDVRPSHEALKRIAARKIPGTWSLVFINGTLDRTLSDLEELGVAADFAAAPPAGERDFADAFEALNAAYCSQGFILKIRDGISFPKPLHILFHTTLEGGASLMAQPRFRVELGARSKLCVFEESFGVSEEAYFVNSFGEIFTGEGSSLQWIRVQGDSGKSVHVARTRLLPGLNSRLQHWNLGLGGSLARHNLELVINHPGIHAETLGMSVLSGSQHQDCSSWIDHRIGGSHTRQIQKNILDGTSRAVFAGEVRIRPGALLANSEQLNNNLLLSSLAEADSKPMLLIEADDVKASHGSTVGRLNQEELFYMMSRGLSRARALPMLAYGFVAGLLDAVEEPALQSAAGDRLRDSFSKLHPENL